MVGPTDDRVPRLLHVLTTPRAEGTPNLVLDWLAAGTGCWQGVLVLHRKPADLTDRLRSTADAYEEHALLQRGYGKFFRITAAAYAAVHRHRPDVVVCWPTGFANWVCAGAFAAGCRRLLVHAGNPATRGRRADWIARYVMWPLAALRARVVCCSDYVRASITEIRGIPRSLCHRVYNCSRACSVATRAAAARSGRTDRTPTAVMVATLEAHKDHATLLRAVGLVLRHRPTFRLWLVGDGSLRSGLQRTAVELGVAGAVKFFGTRTDVPDLLGTADVFVFSTTPQEGLGSVLLEALAAGVPVVASDVPACRELLAGGRWGTLVPPQNPEALAGAIGDLLDHPPAATERAAAGEYAAGFTPERMMRSYLSLVGWEKIRAGGRT